jgi:hypothetical protein
MGKLQLMIIDGETEMITIGLTTTLSVSHHIIPLVYNIDTTLGTIELSNRSQGDTYKQF